ncbi:N-acetylglucosamine kinase [Paenibacillus naphthalenovorans]|uniref:N-acetylglucosamine kinase n=1 Tax=Paenibacillus naphthalenovorans TaxID=162209 RepID=UPI003D27195B
MAKQHVIPLLAVDGGGTKCLAVLIDEHGNRLAQGRAGSCNYQGIGREAAAQEIRLAIETAIKEWVVSQENQQKQADKDIEVECAVFGLAGLDTEHDRGVLIRLVREVLTSLGIKVKHLVVENDGFAALLGATGGKPGILVIAGTGSIVYGINVHGMTARAGGWGHRVGDEGSGYWIGKQAIISILKAEDGRGETSRLGDRVISHLGLATPEALFNWVYGSDYSVEKVGELSRLVSLAAAQGDTVSQRILSMAGSELYMGAKAVIDKLGIRQSAFKVVLQGGVLQNDVWVHRVLMDQLLQYAPLAVLDSVEKEPIYGVMAMGLSHLRKLRLAHSGEEERGSPSP